MDHTASSKRANGLIAVLLITRSRPGPKLVFHYPPIPQYNGQTSASDHGIHSSDSSDSDSDADDSGPESRKRTRGASDSTVRHPEPGMTDAPNPLEKVLGFDVGSLERLLSPGRWCEKKKFEICLDGVTFVGLPVFAKEDGSWAARDEPSMANKPAIAPTLRKNDSADTMETESLQHSPIKSLSSSVAGITITAPDTPAQQNLSTSYKHAPDSFDSHGIASLGTSMGSASTTSGAVAEQMNMFHVVFALTRDSKLRTADLYEHVAKKLSKALKFCQKRTNYVSIETRKLLAVKQRGRAEKTPAASLWTQLVSTSELAWALQEVYTRISADDVAGIRLDKMEMSLQVPPQQRPEDLAVTPLSAILLLESRETLIRTLEDHRDATLLSYFVRETIPTKSLAKQATKLGLPEKTLVFLTQHLIKWRKARAISPLHPRNVYIVSPRAPLKDLRKLGIEYAKRFPALPSMEAMLAMLGGRPVKYGALIQSRDHRVPYMDILAWLVRRELVAQLRTVGWLKMDGQDDDVASVAEEDSATTEQHGMRPMPVSRLLRVRTSVASDDGSSVASDQTAFATGVPQPPTTSTPLGSGNRNESSPRGARQGELPLGIIADPSNPSLAEKAAMRSIEASLEDPELRERFSTLARYFNGEHAFEEIAGREGLKRARVEEWMAELERGDRIRSVRCL
ncbi:hypothetical protein Q7P35_010306 [Cladosporium inversicolor]